MKRIESYLIKQLVTLSAKNDDTYEIEIKSIKYYIPKGGYEPYIKIYWTPIQVYANVSAYTVLQKDIKTILKPYKKYISDISTRMKHPGFYDVGWDISFKLGISEQILLRITKKLQRLKNKTYVAKL